MRVRDAFEAQFSVIGEWGHHRSEVAAADSLVETLHVPLEQAHLEPKPYLARRIQRC